MSTIAHEGNPRSTPTITVSGTLDGTATINVGFPLEDIRQNVADIPTVEYRRSYCDFSAGNISKTPVFNDINFGHDDPIDTLVRSGDTVYGFCVQRICCPPHKPSLGATGVDLSSDFTWCTVPEAIMLYKGPDSGYPRTGICLAVLGGSTREAFTGYAAIIDSYTGLIKLVKWVGQSLQDYGTILGTSSIPSYPFYLGFSADITVGVGHLTVYQADADGIFVQTLITATDTTIDALDVAAVGHLQYIGVVSVGSPYIPGGIARWSDITVACGLCYAPTKLNTDASCDLIFP